ELSATPSRGTFPSPLTVRNLCSALKLQIKTQTQRADRVVDLRGKLTHEYSSL
ncbi:14846_t:CDS:1, partial [Funneliformis mosseae]